MFDSPVRPRVRAVSAGAAFTVLLGFGAVGCGDSGPSQAETFKQDYKEQRTALNAVSDEIGAVLNGAGGKSDTQVVTELRGVEKKYRERIDALAKLDPPKEREADFAAVTSAAKVLDGDLVGIADAAAAGDAAKAKTATEGLLAHIPALKTAAAKLVKALGLPASS